MSANYLVQKKVNPVAIDGPGIEMDYEAHKILLSNEIMIIENLCNVGVLNGLKPLTLRATGIQG